MADPIIALAMVGRSTVSFEVMAQWIETLRRVHWPGPTFIMPEIYAAGAWIGVVPLRNLCTYKALSDPRPWDHLLWIDADHRVHHTLFERVWEHALAELGVVGGPYFQRGYPFEVQAFGTRVPGGVQYVHPEVLVPALQGQYEITPRSGMRTHPIAGAPLLAVAGVGTGCMLVRRDVLEEMSRVHGHVLNTWRAERIDPDEQLRLVRGGQDISGVVTEDILFCCDVADHLGEQVWLDLDPRMETGHMGEEPRGRQHYLAAHAPYVPDGVQLDPSSLPPGYQVAGQPERPVNTTHERERRLRRQLDRHITDQET